MGKGHRLIYNLHMFETSADISFHAAINIYQKTVAHNEKTNSNEISWVLDHSKRFKKSTPFFFGLELNNKIIGFAEISYIKRTRFIIIDYIAIDHVYKTHSAFYSFILLILDYLNSIHLDYDYIGTEMLTSFEDAVSKKEISEFELEGFKVVNALYIQPCLEINNFDSQQEAILMISQRNKSVSNISKNNYFEIVNSIYFDYYYEWDSFFFKDEIEGNESYNQLKANYDKIVSECSDSNIILNGYPFKSLSSENKVIPNGLIRGQKIWQALFFVMVFSVMVLGIIFAVRQMNIELTIAIVLFVVLGFFWLCFLALNDDRAMKIISKIPFISKIIEQLK